MESQGILNVVLGGLLVGTAAGLVLLAHGQIAGVSGMIASAVRPKTADAAWQMLFLVGLVTGGAFLSWLNPGAVPAEEAAPVQLMIGAGLLLAFGARRALASASGNPRREFVALWRRSAVAATCFALVSAAAAWVGRNVF